MLTPETIRLQYFGPRCKNNDLVWRWHRRGWSYPRYTYALHYYPKHRMFDLVATVMSSRRSAAELVAPMPGELEAFRSLLSPADLARCAVASITFNRSNPNA